MVNRNLRTGSSDTGFRSILDLSQKAKYKQKTYSTNNSYNPNTSTVETLTTIMGVAAIAKAGVDLGTSIFAMANSSSTIGGTGSANVKTSGSSTVDTIDAAIDEADETGDYSKVKTLYNKAQSELNSNKSKIDAVDSGIKTLDGDVAKITQETEALTAENTEIEAQLDGELKTNMKSTAEHVEDLEKQLEKNPDSVMLKTSLENAKTKKQEAIVAYNKADDKRKQNEKLIETNNTKIEDLKKQINTKTDEKEALVDQQTELQEKVTETAQLLTDHGVDTKPVQKAGSNLDSNNIYGNDVKLGQFMTGQSIFGVNKKQGIEYGKYNMPW